MSSSFICTSAGCSSGKTAVEQMRATFNDLAKKPGFIPIMFESSVISIENAFHAVYDTIWIEAFNEKCCTVDEIGQQANELTNKMLGSIGAQTLDTSTRKPDPLPDLSGIIPDLPEIPSLWPLAIVAVAVLVVLYVPKTVLKGA